MASVDGVYVGPLELGRRASAIVEELRAGQEPLLEQKQLAAPPGADRSREAGALMSTDSCCSRTSTSRA